MMTRYRVESPIEAGTTHTSFVCASGFVIQGGALAFGDIDGVLCIAYAPGFWRSVAIVEHDGEPFTALESGVSL